MTYKFSVLSVFALSYIGIIFFTKKKTLCAGTGALVILLLTAFMDAQSPADFARFVAVSINWNVLGIFIGTLVIAEAFIESRVPALIAHYLVSRSKNVGIAILLICVMASLLSAFVENVATVLIVAPIALEIARKQRISPVPFLIGLAVSSNLQGTATLIGDPPSMILAGYMKLNFNQFFILEGKLGIFFAVQAGAVISFLILWSFFRQYKSAIYPQEQVKVTSWFPTALILLMIILLAFSSLIDPNFIYLGGVVCVALGGVAGVWFVRKKHLNRRELLQKIDFDTLFFLASIFILVGSLIRAEVMEDIARLVITYVSKELFPLYMFIVWFSVLVSAFVDNVPYITAMVPVTRILSAEIHASPYLLVFGLLIGACLGGNITHVGASANVVAVSILKKNGHSIGLKEFGRIGLPFTIGATLGGSFFIWLLWK